MTKLHRLMPILAFALPALAGPVATTVGSALSLRLPPPVLAGLVPPAPAETPAPERRLYLPLIAPVTVTLPGQGPTLNISLGVALRARGSAGLLSRLQDQSDRVQAGLAETVLSLAESLGPASETLRQALPAALRDAMNAKLVEMGEDPAVLEVLITDWATSG